MVDSRTAQRHSDYQQSTIHYPLTSPDECHQTDILTPDFKPCSRLPADLALA